LFVVAVVEEETRLQRIQNIGAQWHALVSLLVPPRGLVTFFLSIGLVEASGYECDRMGGKHPLNKSGLMTKIQTVAHGSLTGGHHSDSLRIGPKPKLALCRPGLRWHSRGAWGVILRKPQELSSSECVEVLVQACMWCGFV